MGGQVFECPFVTIFMIVSHAHPSKHDDDRGATGEISHLSFPPVHSRKFLVRSRCAYVSETKAMLAEESTTRTDPILCTTAPMIGLK